jgi:hypothetical protein
VFTVIVIHTMYFFTTTKDGAARTATSTWHTVMLGLRAHDASASSHAVIPHTPVHSGSPLDRPNLPLGLSMTVITQP